MSDFLKKLMADVPEDMRQQELRRFLDDQAEPHGGVDLLATAIATAAMAFIQRMPEVHKTVKEVTQHTGYKLPAGDLVFVAALFTAAQAMSHNLIKAAPPDERLTAIMKIIKAQHYADHTTAAVSELLEETLKNGSKEGITHTKNGAAYVFSMRGQSNDKR